MRSHDFVELIDSLSQAKTVEDLHSACSVACQQMGFDRFLYGARFPTSFVKPYFVFVNSYPREWRDRYTANDYMSIDPTVTHCASHLAPIRWDQVGTVKEKDSPVRRFMGEARDFGLNSGISFPVHSAQGEFAMLNFASDKTHGRMKSSIVAATPHASLLSAHLHEAVRRVFQHQVLSLTRVHLTDREKQCLLWAAEGKTTWETSHILGVSERTVIFHLQNAANKLKVARRQQAVARAVSLGLISPQLG